VRVLVWCRDKKGATPKDLEAHPEWEGRPIGSYAVDAAPRVGESIDLTQAADDDDVYEVLYVCHKLLRREVYVEIEWVPDEAKE
jgi:hypothetical protein